VLAFGSSLNWIVSGGTNFWKDIPEKYQSSISVKLSNQGDKEVLSYSKLQEQTTQFSYSLACQKPATKAHLEKSH
jgi:hypothetical protein